MDPLAYYATQGPIASPGKDEGLFADLPGTIEGLCQVVHGVMSTLMGHPGRGLDSGGAARRI